MTFKEKGYLTTPTDDAKVWRYMDLTKFLFILETETLFFPTVASLRKADKWEGSWSNFEFSEYVGGTSSSQSEIKEFWFSLQSKVASHQVGVSCWHKSEDQSNAMWKIYLSGNEGIAIQTSFGNLKEAFDDKHPNWPNCGGNFQDRKVSLIAGNVEYIDWSNPPENTRTLKQFMLKGKEFEYEQEVRMLAELFPIPGAPQSTTGKITDKDTLGLSDSVHKQVMEIGGVAIPIRVSKLIQNIYVTPTVLPWFVNLVEKIVSRYGLTDTKIHQTNTLPRY